MFGLYHIVFCLFVFNFGYSDTHEICTMMWSHHRAWVFLLLSWWLMFFPCGYCKTMCSARSNGLFKTITTISLGCLPQIFNSFFPSTKQKRFVGVKMNLFHCALFQGGGLCPITLQCVFTKYLSVGLWIVLWCERYYLNFNRRVGVSPFSTHSYKCPWCVVLF